MDSSNRRTSLQEKARGEDGSYLVDEVGYALNPSLDPELSPVKWFESPYPKLNHAYFSDYK